MTIRRSHEHAVARTRLLVAGCAGLVVLVTLLTVTPWQVAVLTSWDVAAVVELAWVLGVMWRKDAAGTRRFAMREDDSRATAEVLLLLASVASLVGVGLGLVKAGHEHGAAKAAVTAIAVLSVVLSWAVVNAVYALRYAHLYYSEGGGIGFDEQGDPDYRDFVYMAVTVGMTYQVSDTGVSSKRIRRMVTGHALLSYLFGTGVVAVMINVVAGLLR
jgi:uncharacterized membrane protein